jgi:hypothetical protein
LNARPTIQLNACKPTELLHPLLYNCIVYLYYVSPIILIFKHFAKCLGIQVNTLALKWARPDTDDCLFVLARCYYDQYLSNAREEVFWLIGLDAPIMENSF